MIKIIKVYSGNYDKKEFYSIMGKYFAEPFYQNELPYLSNKDNTIWILNIKNNKIVAFGSIEEGRNKIEFKTDYFETNINDLKEVIENKMKYCINKLKPIETATSNKKIEKLFKSLGFIEYKKTTNYVFMRKEVENE